MMMMMMMIIIIIIIICRTYRAFGVCMDKVEAA